MTAGPNSPMVAAAVQLAIGREMPARDTVPESPLARWWVPARARTSNPTSRSIALRNSRGEMQDGFRARTGAIPWGGFREIACRTSGQRRTHEPVLDQTRVTVGRFRTGKFTEFAMKHSSWAFACKALARSRSPARIVTFGASVTSTKRILPSFRAMMPLA
jgi:hypothetical protein